MPFSGYGEAIFSRAWPYAQSEHAPELPAGDITGQPGGRTSLLQMHDLPVAGMHSDSANRLQCVDYSHAEH